VGPIICLCFNWWTKVANSVLAELSMLAWERGIRVEWLIDSCIDCVFKI